MVWLNFSQQNRNEAHKLAQTFQSRSISMSHTHSFRTPAHLCSPALPNATLPHRMRETKKIRENLDDN